MTLDGNRLSATNLNWGRRAHWPRPAESVSEYVRFRHGDVRLRGGRSLGSARPGPWAVAKGGKKAAEGLLSSCSRRLRGSAGSPIRQPVVEPAMVAWVSAGRRCLEGCDETLLGVRTSTGGRPASAGRARWRWMGALAGCSHIGDVGLDPDGGLSVRVVVAVANANVKPARRSANRALNPFPSAPTPR